MKVLSIIIALIIGIVFLFSISYGSAAIVWSEDFDSDISEIWDLYGYDYPNEVFVYNNDTAPKVVDDMLKMPNTQEGDTMSYIVRNSTVANGTWSFDWIVTEGTNHESLDVVNFMLNGWPRDLNGSSLDSLPGTGYYLILKSGGVGNPGLSENSIYLDEITPTREETLKYRSFDDPITGSHHITITRDNQGEVNMYFDSTTPIITHTDLSTTSSELFAIGSWYGDSVFDNITTSDSIEPPTTSTTSSFFSLFFFLCFGILVLIRRKQEK
jgi:hypothetical protein